ncbi:MAG: hypothetical protein U0414_12605 [Polyangiaceae bacterium]
MVLVPHRRLWSSPLLSALLLGVGCSAASRVEPPPTQSAAPAPCLSATAARRAEVDGLLASGRFARAARIIDAVVSECPAAGAPLAAARARAHAELGDCDGAKDIVPSTADASALASSCAAAREGLDDPERVRASRELARAAWPALASQNWEDAGRGFDAALAKAPTVPALIGAARVAAHRGDAGLARRLFDRAHAALTAASGKPTLRLLGTLLLPTPIFPGGRFVTNAGLEVTRGGALLTADPEQPERMHVPDLTGRPIAFAELPTGLAVLDEAGLTLFDAKPFRARGTFAFADPWELFLSTDATRALVAGDARATAVDLTDPSAPRALASFDGHYAVMSGDGRVVAALDGANAVARSVDAPADVMWSEPNAIGVGLSNGGRYMAICSGQGQEGQLIVIDLVEKRKVDAGGGCIGVRVRFSADDGEVEAGNGVFDVRTGKASSGHHAKPRAPAAAPADSLGELDGYGKNPSEFDVTGDGAFVIQRGVNLLPAFALATLSFTDDLVGDYSILDTFGSRVLRRGSPSRVHDLATNKDVTFDDKRCSPHQSQRSFSADGTRLACYSGDAVTSSYIDLDDPSKDVLGMQKSLDAKQLGAKGDELLLLERGEVSWLDPRTGARRHVDLPKGTFLSASPRVTYVASKTDAGVVIHPLQSGADLLLPDTAGAKLTKWSEDDELVAVGTAEASAVFALPLGNKLADVKGKVFALASGPRGYVLQQRDGLLDFRMLRSPVRARLWASAHDAVLVARSDGAAGFNQVQVTGTPPAFLWCDYGGDVVAFDVCRDALEDPSLAASIFGAERR